MSLILPPSSPPSDVLEVTSSLYQPIYKPKDANKGDTFKPLRLAMEAAVKQLLAQHLSPLPFHYVPGLGITDYVCPLEDGERVPFARWEVLAIIYEFLKPGCLCSATTGTYTESKIIQVSSTNANAGIAGKWVAVCATRRCNYFMVYLEEAYASESTKFANLRRRSASSATSSSSQPVTPSSSLPLSSPPARRVPAPLPFPPLPALSISNAGRSHWQEGSSQAGSSRQGGSSLSQASSSRQGASSSSSQAGSSSQPSSSQQVASSLQASFTSQAGSSSQASSSSQDYPWSAGSRIGANLRREVARTTRRLEREPTAPLERARRRQTRQNNVPSPSPSPQPEGSTLGLNSAIASRAIPRRPPPVYRDDPRPTTFHSRLMAMHGYHSEVGLYPFKFHGLLKQCTNCKVICTHPSFQYHRCRPDFARPRAPEPIEVFDNEAL
ncbi:hypothetical protein DFP72DRAFT_1166144 [Ephemerocybe angulata]|uniref:Uncharacterized protein n=1 Tax=Ephemerocybe angulata TaxID=980116 RepID=A0A8H6M954_9AGAR|nr:hypothetical protein DFP72DRAFT_1166144 [Tulosesus angulatus]